MHPQHLLAALSIALLGLAGCIQGDSPDSPEPVGRPLCIVEEGPSGEPWTGLMCLAEASSRDYEYVHDRYGLVQVTNSTQKRFGLIQVEDEWIVWQSGRSPDEPGAVLYGFNVSSGELVAFMDEPGGGVAPRLSQDRVVYQRRAPDGYKLMLWDFQTRTTQQLDVGLQGIQEPGSFHGAWLVFENRFSPNATENAWWAWNLDDGRRIHLYTPIPDGRRQDLSWETFPGFGNTVHGDHVYYVVNYADPTSKHFNSTIHQVNTNTLEHREYPFRGSTMYKLDSDGQFVVLQASGTIWALNPDNGTYWRINPKDIFTCKLGSLGKAWVSFDCGEIPGRSQYNTFVVNLLTGQRIQIADPEFPISVTATDGETIAIEGLRNLLGAYEHYGPDLYYTRIPNGLPS
jgi:hypothetical protein